MREFSAASKVVKGGTDKFIIGTQSEFATFVRKHTLSTMWNSGMTMGEAKQCAATGHMPSAAASDKFMSKLDGLFSPETSRHKIVDDVVGAVPNVGAFLAGQPMNMRRKVRYDDEGAPLTIVIDTTVSAAVSQTKMMERGATLLALARVLAARRPVDLYFFVGLDGGHRKDGGFLMVKIDTAPLDMARAAFMLAHPAATRMLGYSAITARFNATGTWPFGKYGPLEKADFEKVISNALPNAETVLAVPALMSETGQVEEPISFIKRMVAVYGLRDKGDDE